MQSTARAAGVRLALRRAQMMVRNEKRAAGGIQPEDPELWGGVECTVNRVGDRWFDQIAKSGHDDRLEDLALFAGLGIRALRYPILWERHAGTSCDFGPTDERLAEIRRLGMRPIVGLLHHGSGPRGTSLVDPGFPDAFARYARHVAERYPWVEDWTPINEPLTTARFSALYGLWYPHARGDGAFARAVVGQLRATVLAMREIRRVRPNARLVQTEDLGKTHSIGPLAYQARFENLRRWLTFDLLAGRVRPRHGLYRYLVDSGISEGELAFFREEPCPADVIGANHYVTSERFLDSRLERYPGDFHGGNGRERYADVEAVRVLRDGPAGPRRLLAEAWARYRTPIAITEAHLGCTREDQMRWLLEVWNAARSLRAAGVPVVAVTTWALLGSFDWPSLLTAEENRYEPGAFDLRGGRPRPTGVAKLAATLAKGDAPSHPVLAGDGWWRREDRFLYPPVRGRSFRRRAGDARRARADGGRRLLIAGSRGTLGSAFLRLASRRGLAPLPLSRPEFDIADVSSVGAALDRFEPWAVVNAAGYVRVDDAEREPELCLRENTRGAEVLARECARRGIRLVTFSSDLVFDGRKAEPYVESDAPRPLGVYGRSKAEAESRVLEADPSALVVRTAAFFGPWDRYNFVARAIEALSAGRGFPAANDCVVSPTYVPDLVDATLDLLLDEENGIWHLANEGAVTWAELARAAASAAGLDPGRVEGRPTWALHLAARRPSRSVLASERAAWMPSLEDALARFLAAASPRRPEEEAEADPRLA